MSTSKQKKLQKPTSSWLEPTRQERRLAQSSSKSERKLAAAAQLAAEEAQLTAEEQRESLRTASDVIKRVKWDSSLQRDHFVVGYIDRFIGLVEEEFDTFNWDDHLASLDDEEELGIPRHRIVYFKYKGQVVWDKRTRLDNVFGSCGGKKIEELTFDVELHRDLDQG